MIATIEKPPRLTDAQYMSNLKSRCRQLQTDLDRKSDKIARLKEREAVLVSSLHVIKDAVNVCVGQMSVLAKEALASQ